MIVTQQYARRSAASLEGAQFTLDVAAEASRPPVHLHATVRDGLSYARLMHALYALVCSNLGTRKKDRTAYFAWVRDRYLEELSARQAQTMARMPGWIDERDALRVRLAEAKGRVTDLTAKSSDGYYEATRRYYKWLYEHDRDMWIVLDPVVSVHPDSLILEAFSQDESAYGRVTVPMDGLALHDSVAYGTTNIDFSPDLAREIARIRTYRPTTLRVGAMEVALSTLAGAAIEKKIDLPPTWVRGFLQVQSAATLPGIDLRLSAETLAEALSVLRSRREDRGPRSLRLVLAPGTRPTLIVEPWGVTIAEPRHVFGGTAAQEVRLWGRRRLLVLEGLLPHADTVEVRLLGTGLPSYWTVRAGDLRLDVGLSGWTQNDWSRAAQFDLLASIHAPSQADATTVAVVLERLLHGTPEAIAAQAGIGREAATAALQALCREGRAMYDHLTGAYRWRQLFPSMPEPEVVAEDPRLATVRRLVERRAVSWSAPPQTGGQSGTAAPPSVAPPTGWRRFIFKDQKSDKFWNILHTGRSHVVHFGRTGTDGQRQQKEYATAEEAKVAHDKLVREKTGKGYKEVTAPALSGSAPAPAAPEPPSRAGVTRYRSAVRGEQVFNVVLDIDLDGRAVYAQCTCGTFRRDGLRKGPCPHILATAMVAARGEPVRAS